MALSTGVLRWCMLRTFIAVSAYVFVITLPMLIAWCLRIFSGTSLLLVALSSILNAAVISGDVAYVMICMPCRELDQNVWHSVSRSKLVAAWLAVWSLQAPLWTAFLLKHSPLLAHEVVTLLLLFHNLLVRWLGQRAAQLPSVTLINIARSEADYRGGSLQRFIFARCSLPMAYVLFRGLPSEWMHIAFIFSITSLPKFARLLVTKLQSAADLTPAQSLRWRLTYPETHGSLIAMTRA